MTIRVLFGVLQLPGLVPFDSFLPAHSYAALLPLVYFSVAWLSLSPSVLLKVDAPHSQRNLFLGLLATTMATSFLSIYTLRSGFLYAPAEFLFVYAIPTFVLTAITYSLALRTWRDEALTFEGLFWQRLSAIVALVSPVIDALAR